MADLIEKFFKEDLTEAEKTALDQELASSPESAKRFAEMAESAYHRFGLPEPKWTGPDKLTRHAPQDRLWFWVLALLIAIGGGMVFLYTELNNLTDVTSRSIALVQPTPVVKPVGSHAKYTLKPKETPIPTSKPRVMAQAIPTKPSPVMNHPTRTMITTIPTPPLARPRFTPVNVDQNPNRPFSRLSVQLRLASPRVLAVRVLDSNGHELVPLFNGPLGTGNWSFEWNGALQDGRLAPAGKYKIEVRAGSWVQVKEVLVQGY